MSLPADIANRALDAAGAETIVGDLEQGTREAQVVLRHYGPVLRQLLRAAHWDMARKQAPLLMLGDATGSTPNVGTTVQAPWTYVYAYPTDCVRVRFVPMNYGNPTSSQAGQISLPSTPLMTGIGAQPPSNQMRLVPSRFLVGTDFNYPPQVQGGPGGTEWWNQQGISPSNRTVIMSNVCQAQCVYTCLQVYPSLWDPLFEAAFVASLAERIALPLAKNKKEGALFRDRNIAIAKDAIREARASDGDEGWTTTDHVPDFIRIRSAGAGRGSSQLGGSWGGPGPGCFGYGWSGYSFSNGSAF